MAGRDKTFMLGLQSNVNGNKWNAKEGSSMNITPGTGSFNKYFILDDGSNLPTLGFNNDIYVTKQDITNSEGKMITTITPLNITFTVSETENVTYTIKTVAFYTTAPQKLRNQTENSSASLPLGKDAFFVIEDALLFLEAADLPINSDGF